MSDKQLFDVVILPYMKTCYKCRITKNLLEFSPSKSTKDGYNYYCKVCRNIDQRKRYKTNPYKKEDSAKNHMNLKIRNREFVWEYLSTHPCIDCGDTRIPVLEFDHVRGTKRTNIGLMVTRGYAINTILSEIDKCEVRCCNCHRIKTIKQLGWNICMRTYSPKPARPRAKTNHRGEKHHACKLTVRQVRNIRKEYIPGKTNKLSVKQLASKYNVSLSTIERIVYRKLWKDI